MSLLTLSMALAATLVEVPPVPGLCTAPVPTDKDTPGCYKTGEIELTGAASAIYWHVLEFPTVAAAEVEAQKHQWVQVTQIHSRIWLYVLGERGAVVGVAENRRATIGPITISPGVQVAHFAAATFPPGMRTRVHSHPGPEAFYVVEGQQCMETPTDKKVIGAGGTYVIKSGPHIQAAPRGRRNLVLIIAPKGQAAVIPGGDWQPTSFCDQ